MNIIIQRIITSLILIALLLVFFFYLSPLFFSIALVLALFEIIIFEWSRLISPCHWFFWILTPLYPIVPFVLLIALNESGYRWLLLLMWTLVAVFDSGGYFIGNAIGKNKIAPTISPGKTWEGLIGGFIVTLLFFWNLLAYFNSTISWYAIILITATICLLAFCGDLFESWFKRRAAVKDSGNLLPGHGGLLDRFDSTLFVVIFFFLFKEYLIMLFLH